MTPIGVGLVGAGVVAARHVAALADVSEVRLIAVSDVDTDRARRLAAFAGTEAVGLDAMLDRPDVDVVVLAVPHAAHVDLAVRAAGHGRHLLVEKPLATTVPDCDRIIAAAESAGVLLWVGQQQRQFQQVRAARDLIRDGAIGKPLLYTERRSNDYVRDATGNDRPGWTTDPVLAGGGIAMLVGVHTIDRASWLLDATPVAVAATTATPDGWRIETDAAGTIWFDGAAPAAHFAWHNGRDFYHETIVVGERGQLRLDPAGLTIVDASGAAKRLVEFDADLEYTLSFARQYRALVRALRDGEVPEITPAEGRTAVAAVQAIYASARQGGVRTEV